MRMRSPELTMFRVQAQLAEILGDDNRWYCSQHYRRAVSDPETLARYFCHHGGAINFALRWNEAMGPQNRWFCSEHYRREVTDEPTLWRYYMTKHLEACGCGQSSAQALADPAELTLI